MIGPHLLFQVVVLFSVPTVQAWPMTLPRIGLLVGRISGMPSTFSTRTQSHALWKRLSVGLRIPLIKVPHTRQTGLTGVFDTLRLKGCSFLLTKRAATYTFCGLPPFRRSGRADLRLR